VSLEFILPSVKDKRQAKNGTTEFEIVAETELLKTTTKNRLQANSASYPSWDGK